jgi:hypothetical protein
MRVKANSEHFYLDWALNREYAKRQQSLIEVGK